MFCSGEASFISLSDDEREVEDTWHEIGYYYLI